MSRFILVVGLLTAVAAFGGCVAVVDNATDADGCPTLVKNQPMP